jgi:poly(hydroxyalkanoate) depolymerase family esterase
VHREHLDAMREATALTRAGRLAEATALIQRTLGGAAPVRVVPGEIVIDEERLRDDHPPGAPPGREGSPDVDGGAASRVPGPRCTTGGLRELLRGQLAKVADGVRTHLPPSAPAHGGPAGAPTFSGPLSGVRDGLGDLPGLDKLRDLLGSPGGAAAPGPAVPALPGTTLHAVHRGAAGARPYTLYVPTTGTGPRPLVVMLHGGTQTADDFAAATGMSELAQEHGFLVVYPEQVTSANPMRYWNWFKPADQRRGAGEPSILAGIVGEIAAEHAVDRDRVYVAGFSAGAAMAAVLGAAYPDVFAAVGVHSGLPQGSATDLASALAAMRGAPRARPLDRPVPVIAFHGDADPTVAADNAVRVVEQFTGGQVRGDTLVERGPGRPATRVVVRRDGVAVGELWTVHGSGHAWSGGVAGGSYTDPAGPDASAEMVRFFADRPRRG